MKKIPLTQGKFALVDDEDHESLLSVKWCVAKRRGKFYATRRGGAGWLKHLHREIMKAPAGTEVDHINGDTLDNRRTNLRFATRLENSRNMEKHRGCSSRFKGVYWFKHAKKWMARIQVVGKRRYLGCFSSEEAAAKAYDSTAKIEFGEFARLNFP